MASCKLLFIWVVHHLIIVRPSWQELLVWFIQNGTLKIIDRKKHIFKLAQGEYVAPEKIETIYSRSEAVAQIFIHGDSLQVRQWLYLW